MKINYRKTQKCFENNDKNFTTIPDGYTGDIKYNLYEGSYPYIDPVILPNTTYEKAKEEVLNKLKKQMEYGKTDKTLWASFYIQVDGKWKEDFEKRVKYN